MDDRLSLEQRKMVATLMEVFGSPTSEDYNKNKKLR